MTSSAASRPDSSDRWRWPVDPARYDTTPVLRAAEKDAIIELGPGNLRRLARHDHAARGWQQIRRLLRPLDDAAAALEAPLTSHRRRAMLDATAVVLPMVACQMLLLSRSPHLEDLGTELFEQARSERLLPAARGNTLHAMQRAAAEMGFCDPPQRLTGRHSAHANGGPARMGGVATAVARHVHALAPRPRQCPHHAAEGRPVAGSRAAGGRRPRVLDPADLRSLGLPRSTG